VTYRSNEDALRARIAELEKQIAKKSSGLDLGFAWAIPVGFGVGCVVASLLVTFRHDTFGELAVMSTCGVAALVSAVRTALRPPGPPS
jgi:hypothetical protein